MSLSRLLQRERLDGQDFLTTDWLKRSQHCRPQRLEYLYESGQSFVLSFIRRD